MYRKILIYVMVALVTPAIWAQSGSAQTEASLRAAGYRVDGNRTEQGLPTWDLRDSAGRRLSVSLIGPFTRDRAQALDALRELVYSLDGLEIQRFRVVFDPDRATAVVVPARYIIDGEDYSAFMPSGMQFVYEDALAYDFRMLIDNLAARVEGQFLTEEQFTERIVRAVNNPAAFIQSSDPQFLAQRLEDQQDQVDQLAAADIVKAAEDARLAAEIAALETRGTAALERLTAEGIAALRSMEEALAALRSDHEALQLAFEEQSAANSALAAEFNAMRDGAVVLATRNLFGSLQAINPETIAAVVALRAADPGLSADDARTQVNESLPEGAEPLHARHVQAIYAYYFNDYE